MGWSIFVRVDDDARVLLLERHWEFAATDQDITHEIYHQDAVLEFPQSGERFEGSRTSGSGDGCTPLR
jgi:hypothetical protein